MDNLLSGQRILVVEDEFLVLMVTEEMLRDLGCQSVVAAATIDQALSLIENQTFDVAMLDMNLNGQKPYVLADALSERGIPFLFATGYGRHDIRNDYRDRPLLTKPYWSAELAKALTPLLAR